LIPYESGKDFLKHGTDFLYDEMFSPENLTIEFQAIILENEKVLNPLSYRLRKLEPRLLEKEYAIILE
jgi:hypothetical protein